MGPETKIHLDNILSSSEHPLGHAFVEYTKLFNSLYSPAVNFAKYLTRVVEELKSFMLSIGGYTLRSIPELNNNYGVEICLSSLDTVLFSKVYPLLFELIRKKHEDENAEITQKMSNIINRANIRDKFFGLEADAVTKIISLNGELPFKDAINRAEYIHTLSTPDQKLELLKDTSREIEKYCSSIFNELGADIFIPLFAFVIAHAKIPDLVAECYFIDTFMSDSSRNSLHGYLLINFMAARDLIRKDGH